MRLFTFQHRPGPAFRGRQGIVSGAVFIGAAWALSVTVAALMVVFLWAVCSSRETIYLAGVINTIAFISTVVGGMVSGRLAGSRGWLHGICVGFFYFLLLMILTALVSSGFSVLLPVALKVFPLLLAGVLGGVLGVNLPGRRRVYRHLPY